MDKMNNEFKCKKNFYNEIKKGVEEMEKKTMGIHHITAIVGHPQENVDFYARCIRVTFSETNSEF